MREVWLALRGRLYLSEIGSEFEPKTWPRCRDNLTHWLISTQADTSGREHATYFCLQTKSHAHWDMSGSLQKMMQKLGCDVIDYRQWHPNDHFGLAHCALAAF